MASKLLLTYWSIAMQISHGMYTKVRTQYGKCCEFPMAKSISILLFGKVNSLFPAISSQFSWPIIWEIGHQFFADYLSLLDPGGATFFLPLLPCVPPLVIRTSNSADCWHSSRHGRQVKRSFSPFPYFSANKIKRRKFARQKKDIQ